MIGTDTVADLDNKSSNMNDTLNSSSVHSDRLDFLKRKLKQAKVLQSNKKSSSLNERAIDASFRDENLNRFSGKDVSQLVCIEIFAGSARLSRACKDLGFKTLAVDKITARSEQMHIARFDLCDEDQVQALEQLMTKDADNIVYAHFAPACGTASRAREKPQPHLERQGFKVAKPLRSDQEPEGISGLSGLDKFKTETANIVYASTARLIRHAHSLGIACSLENPGNSIFWLVPCIQLLIQDIGGYDTFFDNCCHGGLRKKLTRWWATVSWFCSLQAECDGGHVHQPWKPTKQDNNIFYPTSEEAAYPILLCQRIAGIVLQQVLNMGASEAKDLQEQQSSTNESMHRFLLGMLPRGKRFKPLVSEYQSYKSFVHLQGDEHMFQQEFNKLPKGTKVFSRRLVQWGEVRVDDDTFTLFNTDEVSSSSNVEVKQVGIPREPDDFVSRAIRCGHPRSMAIHLPEQVTEVLEQNMSGDILTLAKRRIAFLVKWTKRAKELEQDERNFKLSMPIHLRKLLGRKRLLLWKEMLDEYNYPDTGLIDEMSVGFKLTGWSNSSVFPRNVKRPQYDINTLKLVAKGLNQCIKAQLMSLDDKEEVNKVTWEQTLQEVELGYIWRDDEANESDFAWSKRFGLIQKDKVRMIDDCTIGGVNKTIGVVEKYRIHSIDEIAAYVSWMLDFQKRNPSCCHSIMCRTFDLKSAYKQFGLNEHDRNLVRLAVKDTSTHSVRLFGMNSLPFGAVGSVGGFLRVSMSVWFLGMLGMGLAWTAYFDDFTLFSSEPLIQNAEKAAQSLFELLGLDYAKEGSKAGSFDTVVKTLGLQIDLSNFSGGEVLVGHTESRRNEMNAVLSDILSLGSITSKQAESIRGRLHWFESFAFGRVGNQAIKTLGSLVNSERKTISLTPQVRAALFFLKDRVLVAPPLKLVPASLLCWIIFTDGASEGDDKKTGGVGGVLISPYGSCHSFFGDVVPNIIMERLCETSLNPIYELEVCPVLIAVNLWGVELVHSQSVFYLDNDAARSAYIKGVGSTHYASLMVDRFVQCELELQIKSWFSRVPSYSNVADAPSRLSFGKLEELGAYRRQIDWAFVASVLGMQESIL